MPQVIKVDLRSNSELRTNKNDSNKLLGNQTDSKNLQADEISLDPNTNNYAEADQE